ncbi:MAG: hypothetical protein Q9177_004387 [Variospora cf. flavescens]
MGAVDPLEYDTDGEFGTGVDTGLPPLDEDLVVDIFRSHEDFAVALALNSNTEFAWVDEGRECPAKDDVEAAVHFPLSGLLDEDRGQPIEFRFRNLVVGAEAGLGSVVGVTGGIAVADASCELAKGGVFRLLDEGGLASVACELYPNPRPIAATPRVPVAHSWPQQNDQLLMPCKS